MASQRYNVKLKYLPDGRVLTHLFVPDEKGPIISKPSPVMTELGPFTLGGVNGRIACNPKQNSVTPRVGPNGEIYPCIRSASILAVTCPKCLASADGIEYLKQHEAVLAKNK